MYSIISDLDTVCVCLCARYCEVKNYIDIYLILQIYFKLKLDLVTDLDRFSSKLTHYMFCKLIGLLRLHTHPQIEN